MPLSSAIQTILSAYCVLAHLERKKKDLNTIHGGLGALGDIIFIWAHRMDQNDLTQQIVD